MLRFILKRILTVIPVVLLVAIAIFTIMYFCPGDPVKIILGNGAAEEDIIALRDRMGLNDSFFVQLGRFMHETFIKFDLGVSYANGIPIADEIATRFPKTLVLALSAMLLEVLIGVPLGMTAATHRGGWPDHLCMLLALIGISVPAFWIGLQLLLLFSLKLSWLPAYGVESWKGWILPIAVNSLRGIAQMARQTRSSMLEVIRSDYISTARSKGLSEQAIRFGYALPNALIPLIQTMGNNFGMSLGGTVIIENVFSISGIGQYMVQSIVTRDYAVIRGTVVVLAIAFSLVMLIVDVVFGFVDPRIRAQYEGRNRLIKAPVWMRRKTSHA
jgi:peptide/nickel transport system permease protein